MKELDINLFFHSSFVFALFSHRQIDKCILAQDFLFVFKARKQVHSELCNCFRNAEDEQKDKPECTSHKIPIPLVRER